MTDIKEYIDSQISMYTSVLESNDEEKNLLIAKMATDSTKEEMLMTDGEILKKAEEDLQTSQDLFYRVLAEEGLKGYLAALQNIAAYVSLPKTEHAETVN